MLRREYDSGETAGVRDTEGSLGFELFRPSVGNVIAQAAVLCPHLCSSGREDRSTTYRCHRLVIVDVLQQRGGHLGSMGVLD